MLGPRRWRRILSGDGAAKEQAARYSDGCPYYEAPTHQTDPLWLPDSRVRKYGGRAPIPILVYGISIEGSGGTLQISAAQGN
jgi:hypothetical protein